MKVDIASPSDSVDPPRRWPREVELAFEHSPFGVALVTAEGGILRANPALCDMLGCTEEDLQRRGMKGMVHDDDIALERASRAALESNLDKTMRFDVRLRHRRGASVWGSMTRIVSRGADGKPRYYLDEVLDLTEQRRADKEIVLLNNLLEQRIRRRTRELEESNADLREFAYAIAHDLRGPLGSIDGFAARLVEELGDTLDERNKHYLERVRAGVHAMSELTDGLLALADISRAELTREHINLSTLAAGIVARLKAEHPARKVETRVGTTPHVIGDVRLLGSVLEHLIGNAWKFTTHQEVPRIDFGATEDDGTGVHYFVRDNGIGFDPTYADKLFTPFQRLHNEPEYEGRGIGLALVRRIVAKHGGRAWAEARPDGGAIFYFTVRSYP